MTQSEKAHSRLLSPALAVRLAWAMTGQFVKASDSEAKVAGVWAKGLIDDIRKQAADAKGREQEYIDKATGTIQATMRTLDTVYKGRELNFEENERVRNMYLENFRDNLAFGVRSKDFLKSLPTMAITTGTGVFSLAQVEALQGWPLALLGLALAGLGHVINVGIVRVTRGQQQNLYIRQDYERNLYYNQYMTRVRTTLLSLYLDVDRDHQVVFGEPYPGTAGESLARVEEVLRGARPTMCPYVHKHMRENSITSKLWPLCEVGPDAAKTCSLWEEAATRITGPMPAAESIHYGGQ